MSYYISILKVYPQLSSLKWYYTKAYERKKESFIKDKFILNITKTNSHRFKYLNQLV